MSLPDRSSSEPCALLLALRGWSRGCAALARREFAKSRGRARLRAGDLSDFAAACSGARSRVTAATLVASLLLAARPASADILRGGAGAGGTPPGTASAATQAALAAARERQAAQVNRSREALARTTQAIQALRLAQQSARSGILSNPAGVIDGLGAGGLLVANGAAPGSSLWQGALAPTQSVSGDRTRVEIVQTSDKAVLTWDGFNVGLNTDLRFNQSAGGADASRWIALNRVTDASLNPSHILGNIKAEGQVYIVNPNGVIFHGSSRVDAHTLLASGLDFRGASVAERDATFRLGLASDDNRANYTLGVDSGSGRTVGDVSVHAGAQIVSDGSGAVFLFGGRVDNAGTLEARDGQVLLAAGERVWVTKNTVERTEDAIDLDKQIDKDLRGVRASVQGGGEISQSGLIEALRGNITLSARDILHTGVSHTTSTTTANGSISLIAGDAAAPDAVYWMWPSTFGSLTLGSGSLLAITPDDAAVTGFANQFRPGKIDLFARTVTLAEGARVHAPGASMAVIARTHTKDATAANDPSRIYLASGSEIDLAGLAGVEVAMERNTVTANLRLDELKDSPLLRESPLRGAKVSVDLRRDTTLADLSGYYGLIEYGAHELMTSGGSLKLDSGSVITRAGSLIDLSGGSVAYRDGYITTTRLLGADGRIYDIATARKDIAYAGVYDTVRRFEEGYWEGRDAGTLRIGPALARNSASPEALNLTGAGTRPYFFAFEGDLAASTTAGRFQTLRPGSGSSSTTAWRTLARSASLVIGYELDLKPYGPSVRVGAATPLGADFTADSPIPGGASTALVLPERFFDGSTLGHVRLLSGIGGGDLTVDAGVTMNLGSHGSLDFHGSRAFIDGAIVAHGGSIALQTDLAYGLNASTTQSAPEWNSMPEELRPRIRLGSAAALDVSGVWTNARLDGDRLGARPRDGGSVSLKSAYDLLLAPGARLDVRGGAELTAANRLLSGNGGSLTLQNDLLPTPGNGFGGITPKAPEGSFDVFGASLLGFAPGRGASLALGASRPVLISADAPESSGVSAADTLVLRPDFFRSGGFLSRSVAGSGSLRVASGVTLEPRALSLLPNAALWSLSSGADLSAALPAGERPLTLRDASSLTLSVALRDAAGKVLAAPSSELLPGLAGDLVFEAGAAVLADPGSSVSLYALRQLRMDGTISTPGGRITLGLTDAAEPATLVLGSQARLLAPGYLRETPEDGVTVRSVESAGSVTLKVVDAQGGATRVFADSGALIDLAAVSGDADLRTAASTLSGGPVAYRSVRVHGDAGELDIEGFRGGSFAARVSAGASAPEGRGGSVTVIAGDLKNTSRSTLTVHASTDDTAAFPVIGDATPAAGAEVLRLAERTLDASGADSIALGAPAALAFAGDVSLSARRELTVVSPRIGLHADTPEASVELAAASVRFTVYPELGNDSQRPVPGVPAAPATLTGSLLVRGGLIDIVQTLDLGGGELGGFSQARFESAGDIRLTVGNAATAKVGRLHSAGALTLSAAQTYVTTASVARPEGHAGFLVSSDRSVTFLGNGAPAPAPFSYGETLTVSAPVITQAGVLRAPLGGIRLNATESLTLAPGSLTSVSAEGKVMPIGAVSGGFVSPFPIESDQATLDNLLSRHPGKSVEMNAPTVRVLAGATLDVSGGGDLSAYEFIPGNGGSADLLRSAGFFAVLPGYVTPGAPVYSARDLADGSLRVGDAVRLEGAPGLAAGVYTLLPAHFALLPGAFAVTPFDSGYADTLASTTLPDGSHLVSARRVENLAGTGDGAVSRWRVMSGETIRRYSSYNEYSYDKFLTDATTKAGVTTPLLAADAGSVLIRAGSALDLSGTGRFGAPSGARAGSLDIAADKIAVVAPGADAPDGFLTLEADSLNRFGVASLLLGGSRKASSDGASVQVSASEVLLANDAASALTVPDLILAATDRVTLADDAVIRASGDTTGIGESLAFTGNGAVLRASTSASATGLTRTGATTDSGTLVLGERVRLAASGALVLEGSASVENRPSGVFEAPRITLASALVSVGDAPSGTPGLLITGDTLERFGNAGELIIRSHNTVDFHGSAQLGALDAAGRPRAGNLTLDAAALRGLGGEGDAVVVAARSLTLANTSGATAPSAGTGAASLTLLADTLTLGKGVSALVGFGSAELRADTVTGSGTGGLAQAGDLTVRAGRVETSSGADTTLSATGELALLRSGAVPSASSASGGRLALSGATVLVDTTVNAASGIIEARATSGDLTLGENARVNATGTRTAFFDTVRHADAGTVRLASDTGSVRLLAGSRVDVSAAPTGGDAGTLELRAASGALVIEGGLLANASSGRGGSFTADAGALDDFNALNRSLNTAGFTASRTVRVRSGDLTLASGETLDAHRVDLRADAGRVLIDGRIDASADERFRDGGDVSVRGGSGVALGATGSIDIATAYAKSAKGFDTASGKLALTADSGTVSLASGSTVDAAGGGRSGGSVVITAQRDGSGVAIGEFAARVRGQRELIVQGRRDYAATSVTTAVYNTALGDAATWMTGASAMADRLGSGVRIRPQIRIASSGDLTLTNDLSLHTRRYDGAVGSLLLESTGDLRVNASLSDGFSSAATTGTLLTGPSWSLGLSAGRDLLLGSGSTGRIVRTGTGELTLSAGRDLVLGNVKSTAYTAGSKVPDAPGYSSSGRLGDYPVDGGDLAVRAGRDILSPVTGDFLTAWQFRYGAADTSGGLTLDQTKVARQTGWSVVFANFEQGLGALGGGNVSVAAGRDIRDLPVMLPTTGQQTTAVGEKADASAVVVRGGGNLDMRAGRDLLGGVTLLGRGEATLVAGGAVESGSKSLQRKELTLASNNAANYESRDLHALYALSDAALTVKARERVVIEAALDPMMIPSVAQNRTAANGNKITFFNSYTERTALEVTAASGDIVYLNNPWTGADLARGAVSTRQIHQLMSVPGTGSLVNFSHDLLFTPGTLRLSALQGDVAVEHRYASRTNHALRVAPTTRGNLELLAAGELRTNTPILMMDVAPEYLRGAASPMQNTTQGPAGSLSLAAAEVPGVAANFGRGTRPSHAGDSAPALLYALTGDIAGVSELDSGRFIVQLPKSARVRAGGDIADVTFGFQHNSGDEFSVISAGRDLLRPDVRVMGSGALWVQAGRDIDLTAKTGAGLVSVGNIGNLTTTYDKSTQRLANTTVNTALGTSGADITLVAGAPDADYAGFAARYLDPAQSSRVVRNYLPELRTFLGASAEGLDDAGVLAAFAALPAEKGRTFLLDVYFTELRETGIDVTNPDSPRFGSYARGFDAVKALFGDAKDAPRGDIRLFGKPLATREGGDIRVLAPRGAVAIDSVSNPASGSQGIVTQKGGDIRMMSGGDIALANSRVFTLQGGDVLMWTSKGSITAGSGSSTLAKPPALTYFVDADANVLLNAGSLQTGSGIGVLDANRTGQVDSRLDLIAPAGTVDAGDAGIRSAGAINIAAQTILGAANISAGGAVTGVSAAPTVNVAAVASANTAAATTAGGSPDAAEKASRQAAGATESAASLFSVEVLGFGGEAAEGAGTRTASLADSETTGA